MLLKALFALAWLAALVLAVFFVIGVGDGSVSSFNILLWAGLLSGSAAILGGGHWLAASGQRVAAGVLVALLAAPVAFSGLFMLLVLILEPRWN